MLRVFSFLFFSPFFQKRTIDDKIVCPLKWKKKETKKSASSLVFIRSFVEIHGNEHQELTREASSGLRKLPAAATRHVSSK